MDDGDDLTTPPTVAGRFSRPTLPPQAVNNTVRNRDNQSWTDFRDIKAVSSPHWEWISEGDTVAIIGKDDTIDIVAEVPERFIQYIKNGMRVNATANGSNVVGTVIAVVPRGDVTTRTFPVKIRTPNELGLIEGMSARVTLPTGNVMPALMVPRDAVISKFGQNVVYTVLDAKSNMIPVQIVGYDGLTAGVEAQGLAEDTEPRARRAARRSR